VSSESRLTMPLLSVFAAMSINASATEPPNSDAVVTIGTSKPFLEIAYGSHRIFSGQFEVVNHSGLWRSVKLQVQSDAGTNGEITQHIRLVGPAGSNLHLKGRATGSEESFPAETYSPAQDRFKLIRNSVGISSNLRNNAIYDRKGDWMMEGNARTELRPAASSEANVEYDWSTTGSEIDLTFRPRFYQKHKNIAYFRPWEYKVWRGSVTGWCSWWAYFTDVSEKDVERVSKIFSDKLRDFGYSYIQIDDGYQASGGGLPKDWLNTDDRFPRGLEHLSKTISAEGLEPALWVNVHFGDEKFALSHPDLFVQDRNGKPYKGPWIDYGLDGSNKKAIDEVVRPTYRALHRMGWKYVKVDTLRHLLYDIIYPRREFFTDKGIQPEVAFRDYLTAIRQEIGPETYMLACWGVLPEAVGIADGCRLGGDGFGPSTLQQYTSWNNVVWRNDPDHCDVKPLDHASAKYLDGEELIRPVLVSMAGAQLLLSDKPEVYENDANLEGVKRSSPILFTLPGQLYDYDPVKTDHLKSGLRNTNGGANSGPIDADQRGEVCPWWMLDINEPYESWTVLTHMNWENSALPSTQVKFQDLGLAPAKYSVFEFWSKKYLGDFSDAFLAKSLDSKAISTYAIRKTLERPQILSTSRHISQGGVDLETVSWDGKSLSGSSKVVKGDAYTIYVRLPAGYQVKSATVAGKSGEIRVESHLAEINYVPKETGQVRWRIAF